MHVPPIPHLTSTDPQLAALQPIRMLMSIAAFLLFTAQGLFVFNLFWSMRKGRPAGSNPFAGSSSTSTPGSPSRAWASPSRWRIPSE